MNTKKAICIIGMHRSGTSTITRVLNISGISLGEEKDIMKPDSDNPKGFWENNNIVTTHNEILQSLSRTWDSIDPLPNKWWKKDELTPFRNKLKEMALTNFLNNDIWMWKDPRSSLLIPLWKEILKELNITPHYIVCVRNPLDVYLSLKKRNQFTFDKSLRLWNLYTLSSLFWTKHENRSFIHYDSLLNETEKTLNNLLIAMKIEWPENKDQIMSQLNEFIDQKLRNSYSTIDELMNTGGLLKETRVLYPILLQEIENSSSQFQKIVDDLYHSLSTINE